MGEREGEALKLLLSANHGSPCESYKTSTPFSTRHYITILEYPQTSHSTPKTKSFILNVNLQLFYLLLLLLLEINNIQEIENDGKNDFNY